MSGVFDPSPRSAKRRKTIVYSTRRSTLQDHEFHEPGLNEDTAHSPIDAPRGRERIRKSLAQGSPQDEPPSAASDLTRPEEVPTAKTTRSKRKRTDAVTGDTNLVAATAQDEDGALPEDQTDGQETITTSATKDNNDSSVRSSGRSRRRPKRFGDELEAPKTTDLTHPIDEQAPSSQKQIPGQKKDAGVELKGILTPRRRKGQVRKSVAFQNHNEREIAESLGFKDIDTSSLGNKATHLVRKQPSAEDEDTTAAADESLAVNVTGDPREDDVNAPGDEDIASQPVDELFQASDERSQRALQEMPPRFEDDVSDPSWLQHKKDVLSRMTSRKSAPLVSLERQYEAVLSLLSAAVTAGESNSLLLLGSRGVGKSLLINTALSEISRRCRDDFHVVRLNGFYQTDDRLAIREIWRQLGREMQVSEMEPEISTYADMMASLLALLSHPEEVDPGQDPMATGRRTAKSVVFILDEFDLFTYHARQTLLYNLFDIAQSKKAPIAVLGCSTRMDVVECLEKRVKSRFSHRWIHVPRNKNLAAFRATVASCLSTARESSAGSSWRDLLQAESGSPSRTREVVDQIFWSSRDVPETLITLYPTVATLKRSYEEDPEATVARPSSTPIRDSSQPPSTQSFLSGLPVLHLALLTAAARLGAIHHLSSVNFNLVYAHYTELIARARLQQSAVGSIATGGNLRRWGRDVAHAAWEDLQSREVLLPLNPKDEDHGGSSSSKMVKSDVSLDDVAWAIQSQRRIAQGSAEVMSKWCREI